MAMATGWFGCWVAFSNMAAMARWTWSRLSIGLLYIENLRWMRLQESVLLYAYPPNKARCRSFQKQSTSVNPADLSAAKCWPRLAGKAWGDVWVGVWRARWSIALMSSRDAPSRWRRSAATLP